jgi:hypothetical protein
MWMYLFSQDDPATDPVAELRALVELAASGGQCFLKLSTHDDAPLKGGRPGGYVFLCTRTVGDWTIHAEAKLAGEAVRGPTPEAVAPIYGITGDQHWWRALTDFRSFDPPVSPAELSLDDRFLPRSGRAQIIRVGQVRRTSSELRASGLELIDRTGQRQAASIEDDIRTVAESSEDIIIDEQGRIFRLTGEQIVRPGLEPERILKSLADVAAGKVFSLDELRARRA